MRSDIVPGAVFPDYEFPDRAPNPDPSSYAKKFSGKYAHRTIKGGVGHNLPQEAPQAFGKAVTDADSF